jgi:methyl-accepting chemotaxis protein
MRDTLRSFSLRVQDTTSQITLGYFKERVDVSGLQGVYEELAHDVNSMAETIVRRIDSLPMPLLAIDPDFKVRYVNKAVSQVTGLSLEESIGANCYDLGKFEACKNGDGSCACGQAMKNNEVRSSQTKTVLPDGTEYHMNYSGTPIQDKEGNVVGVIEMAIDITEQENEKARLSKRAEYQNKNVERLLSNINQLERGLFSMDFEELEGDTETFDIQTQFREINQSLESSVSSISDYVKEISNILQNLSKSKLNVSVEREYIGEFESIKIALNTIIDSLNDVIEDIYETSSEVLDGSTEMNVSSQDLSSGATEQAASVEEISATVTQVAAQVQENASNAESVNESTQIVSSQAEESNDLMFKLL